MADVSIDASISTSTARGIRSVVFNTASSGYWFYIDSGGTFVYSRTTDGGATWGAAVTIASATTNIAFDVWYLPWTPGITTERIDLCWFDSTNDQILYRRFDPVGNTFVGAAIGVASLTSAVAGVNCFCSLTHSRSGYIYIVAAIDASNEQYFGRSTDDGSNWSAALSATFWEANPDHAILYPATGTGDNNDIWAIYHDSSATALTMKMWDSSAAAQVESSTVQTIAAVGTDLTAYQYPFSGSIRNSDGALVFVSCSERDTATADMQCWVVTAVNAGSLTGITAKTNITTNIDDNYNPQVFINPVTDDIYVAYNGKRDGSEVLGTTTKIYYTKSTDGGTTWTSGDTAYQEGATSANLQAWTPLTGRRFYVGWRVGTTLLGNKVNSIVIVLRQSLSSSLGFNPTSLLDSYSEVNANTVYQVYSGSITSVAQSFTAVSSVLASCKFYLDRAGSPTGNVVAKLYAITGSSGTTGKPTGSALATSDNVDVTTLPSGSTSLITFTFSGANQYTMVPGDYCIAVEYSGGDASNYVEVWYDNSSPTHGGNLSYFSSSVWTAESGNDLAFYIYTIPITFIRQTLKALTAALSFIGNLSTVFTPGGNTKLLTGALSFVGTQSKKTFTILSVALSFVGNLIKRTSTIRTAAVSFVGAFTKSARKLFTGIIRLEIANATTTNLISYWKLDETVSSSDRVDSYGANNLTASGNNPTSASGVINNGLIVDGGGPQAVFCASNASLQVTGDFFFSVWARVDQQVIASGYIIAKEGGSSNHDYGLYYHNVSGFVFGVNDPTLYAVAVGSTVPNGTLSHIVAWYDSSDQKMRMRINDATTYVSSMTASLVQTTVNFAIGCRSDGFAGFTGLIDEVGFWKHKPTAAEITALYNSGAGLPLSNFSTSVLIKKTLKSLSGVVSFVGSLLKTTSRTLAATLSFIGNLTPTKVGQLFFQAVNGTLSFSGNIVKSTSYHLSATVSFIGSFIKIIGHSATGTLSFIGAATKRTSTTKTGTLSFIGSLSKAGRTTLVATLSFVGAITKRAGKFLAGSLPFTGAQTKSSTHGMSASSSFSGVLTKSTLRTMTAVLSFIGSIVTGSVFASLLTGTLSFAGTMSKRTLHSMTAALSFISLISKSTNKALTASVSYVGTLIRSIRSTLAATLSFIGAQTKRTTTTKTGTLSFVGAFLKQCAKTFSAAVSFIGTLTKIPAKALSGAVTFAGAISKYTSYHLNSILSFVGALDMATAGHFFQSLNASLDFSGTLSRNISYHLASTLSFVGTMLKRLPRVLTAAISFISSLTTRNVFGRLLTGTLGFSGAITKHISKSMAAVVSFAGATVKRIPVELAGILSVTGTLLRRSVLALTGSLSFVGQMSSVFGKMLTASIGFEGLLIKSTQRLLEGVISFIGDFTAFVPSAFTITLESTLDFSGFLAARLPAIIRISLESVQQVIEIVAQSVTSTIKIVVKDIRNIFNIQP